MEKLSELDRQFSPFDDLFLEDMYFIMYHIDVEIPVHTFYSFLKLYCFAELIQFIFFLLSTNSYYITNILTNPWVLPVLYLFVFPLISDCLTM